MDNASELQREKELRKQEMANLRLLKEVTLPFNKAIGLALVTCGGTHVPAEIVSLYFNDENQASEKKNNVLTLLCSCAESEKKNGITFFSCIAIRNPQAGARILEDIIKYADDPRRDPLFRTKVWDAVQGAVPKIEEKNKYAGLEIRRVLYKHAWSDDKKYTLRGDGEVRGDVSVEFERRYDLRKEEASVPQTVPGQKVFSKKLAL